MNSREDVTDLMLEVQECGVTPRGYRRKGGTLSRGCTRIGQGHVSL
jgi:hypothetical protein